MTTARRSLTLSVPRRSPGTPTAFEAEPGALGAWLDGLPIHDASGAAGPLLDALRELNRLEIEPALRFTFLETLRPVLHYVCSGLSQKLPRRALHRSEAEVEPAAHAQALQGELATGYRIIVVDGLRAGDDPVLAPAEDTPAWRVLVSIHRAITELGQTLLRSLQLYTPPPPELWAQLHQLYYVAELKSVLPAQIPDPEHGIRRTTSVVQAYARALMLGAARPNTLRPTMLGALYGVLEDWSRFVRIRRTMRETDGAFLTVDLQADAPPLASAPMAPEPGQQLRQVDAAGLLAPLSRYLDDALSETTDPPALLEGTDDDLVRHAVHAWGRVSKRSYKRMPVEGELELCAGMGGLHHHLVPEADRPAGARSEPVYRLRLADASPGGYGLVVEGEFPDELYAGELVGVRDGEAPDWRIAVVRWFGNTPGAGRLGIELLAPRAEPCVARPLATRGGGGGWVPVLRLPAVPAISQPAMLVTPRGAFRVGQKLAVHQGDPSGPGNRVLLEAAQSITETFQRFETTTLATTGDAGVSGFEVEFLDADDDVLDHFDL
jgi:hypothetical protein